MKAEKQEKETTSLISDSFGHTKEKGTNEIVFRRWIIRKIDADRITAGAITERFNLIPESVRSLIP